MSTTNKPNNKKKEKRPFKHNQRKDQKKKQNKRNNDNDQKKQKTQKQESNPNEIDPSTIFHLDEEELEHKQYLQKTYRDRAKERRDGKTFDYLDESELQEIANQNNTAENHMFGNSGEYLKSMKKGLDLDLYRNELEEQQRKEEEEEELLQQQQNLQNQNLYLNYNESGAIINPNVNRKPKSAMAMGLERLIMVQKHQAMQQLQQIDKKQIQVSSSFKSNTIYEYDLHHEFGSDLPKVIIKTSSKINDNNEVTVIPMINPKLIKKIDKILTYIQGGQQKLSKKNSGTEKIQKKEKKDKDAIFENVADNQGQNNFEDEEDDEDAIFAITTNLKQNPKTNAQNLSKMTSTSQNNDKKVKLFSLSPSRSSSSSSSLSKSKSNSESSSQSQESKQKKKEDKKKDLKKKQSNSSPSSSSSSSASKSKSRSRSRKRNNDKKSKKYEDHSKRKKRNRSYSSSSSSSSSKSSKSYSRSRRKKQEDKKKQYKKDKYRRNSNSSDRKKRNQKDRDKDELGKKKISEKSKIEKDKSKQKQNDKIENQQEQVKKEEYIQQQQSQQQQASSIFQNLSVKTNKKLENEQKTTEVKIDENMIHDIKKLQSKVMQEVRKKVIHEDDSYMECYPVNDTTLLEMKQQKDQFGTGLIDTFKVKKQDPKWQPKHGKKDADKQLQKIEKFMKDKNIKNE